METGDLIGLDQLWQCLPNDTNALLRQCLPDIWWVAGHQMSTVALARSDKVEISDAMLLRFVSRTCTLVGQRVLLRNSTSVLNLCSNQHKDPCAKS